MIELETPRLRMREAEADDLPGLLAVYLSNPEFVGWNEGSAGEPGHYDLEMSRRDWWVARMTPGRHVLGVYLRETGEAVGQVDFWEENPEDGMPWLGLVMIAKGWQRRGLGSEVFAGLADYFHATYGWPRLRLGVLKQNAPALTFWRRLGFAVVVGEGDEARKVVVMERVMERVMET